MRQTVKRRHLKDKKVQIPVHQNINIKYYCIILRQAHFDDHKTHSNKYLDAYIENFFLNQSALNIL